MLELETQIPESCQGLRLDAALAQCFPEHSRARLSQWLKAGFILVDGKSLPGKRRVQGGEFIQLNAQRPPKVDWIAQDLPLEISFEDCDIIIINKPAGLVTHPGAGNPDQTLVNALLHHYPSLEQLPRAGIIHRLDKNTTGLLIIAKNLSTHTYLIDQMQSRLIKREYLALVAGEFTGGGTINAPIGRHPRQRTQMAIVDSGKPAITHYTIHTRYKNYTLLAVQLETGRTHQIRVHCAHIKHPIIGDPIYGRVLPNFRRQALHAYQLTLTHPNGKLLSFNAPIPKDFQALLETLSPNG